MGAIRDTFLGGSASTSPGDCGDPSVCTYMNNDPETGCCPTCPNRPGGVLHSLANGFRWKPKAP